MVGYSSEYIDVLITSPFMMLGEEFFIDPMFGEDIQFKYCSFVKWLPPEASRESGSLNRQFFGKPVFSGNFKDRNGVIPDFPLTKTTPFRGRKSKPLFLIKLVPPFKVILDLKIELIGEVGELFLRNSVMAPSRCFLAPDKGAVRLTLVLT